MLAGGPPVRGDLLRYWEPAGALGPEDARRWAAAAERIATGVAELAHLDAFVDATNRRVGFGCGGDAALAAAYERAIRRENVEGRAVAPPVPGRSALPRTEVLLPCRPDATDEEIRHAVLAVMKASHGLEFTPEGAPAAHPGRPGQGAPDAARATR